MNVIPSKMIDVSIDKKSPSMSLEDFIKMSAFSESIPITMFGSSISSALIDEAVSYLVEIGGGSVSVPKTDVANLLKIHVKKNKAGEFVTKFEYHSYRYPIGSEARPYTGDDWEVGDIVYNADISDSDEKCFGWMCVQPGAPGEWIGFLSHELVYDSNNEVLTFSKAKGSSGAGSVDSITQAVLGEVNRSIILELKASEWSDTAPYTQTAYDDRISSTDNPMVTYSIETGSSVERILAVKDAFSCIDDGTTYTGYVEFVCATEKPKVDFKVMLKGM